MGSELRKLRPTILWRSPSKRKDDNYYFRYDLLNEKLGTVRLKNLINISSNRIKEL